MNGWKLIDWDGNKAFGYKCWRKKFRGGHISVGVGVFTLIVYSFGANSDRSYSSTRWRNHGKTITEQAAMNMIDRHGC